MPQTLYKFGIDPADPAVPVTIPTPIITDGEIKMLWSSWCDLIYATVNGDGTRSTTYFGTSLNPSQQAHFPFKPRAPGPAVTRQRSLSIDSRLQFFGTTMHDGLRGCIAANKVFVYSTPAGKATMVTDHHGVDSWEIPRHLHNSIYQVSMCSDNSLLVASRPRQNPASNLGASTSELISQTFSRLKDCNSDGHDVLHAAENTLQTINYFRDLREFRDYYEKSLPIKSVASFAPVQLVVNATTATALDQHGRIYTYTTDPRYPSCLGRPNIGQSVFEPVPYLEETNIVKTASGGYMTAAISEDGELFLWGQANPGTEGELSVLQMLDYESRPADRMGTSIKCEGVQDDDVKCLCIHIEGREARAYDVALGHGHILVAAEDGIGKYVVFGAGCAAEGQLGIPGTIQLQKDFHQVEAFTGKRVIQMMASGWSSFVVVEDQVGQRKNQD